MSKEESPKPDTDGQSDNDGNPSLVDEVRCHLYRLAATTARRERLNIEKLAGKFTVGRPKIDAVLIELAAQGVGLIEKRVGGGYYLREPQLSPVFESRLILENLSGVGATGRCGNKEHDSENSQPC
ncbi:MAG: hypothetical protein P8N76_08280 [Pirellulaceae bacterium]|nr:hypothetical protein [Pirellulaceae bacterium]